MKIKTSLPFFRLPVIGQTLGSVYPAIALVIFLLLALSSASQIIDNRLGNAFKEEMYFNQEFLWQNKIKSITGVVSIKRPNRPIESKPDLFVYRFNTVGLLQQMDKITSLMNIVDSLRIDYKRNSNGELFERSESGKKGYYSTQFVYDNEGRVVRLDYGKNENISPDMKVLVPGQRITINSESFSYAQNSSTVLRKNKMNNYGLHYASSVITKNELGYVMSEIEELVMSAKTSTRTYTYDLKGWVTKIETSDNTGGAIRSELFRYDTLGNLLTVTYKKGNEIVEEVEVLYTETMLIEALLRENMQTREIEITKFSYEFHP
jgi:hypothetical protein